jgi:PAS domain S-box-containing protein
MAQSLPKVKSIPPSFGPEATGPQLFTKHFMFGKLTAKYSLVIQALAFGIILGFLDVIVDAFVLREGTFVKQIFLPSAMEIWTRGLILAASFVFGVILLRTMQKRRSAEVRNVVHDHDLQFIFEHLPDAAVLIDRKNRILDLNKPAETLTQLTRDELLARPFGSIFLPVLTELDDSMLGLTERDRSPLVEPSCYCFVRSDGKELTVDIQIFPLQLGTEKLNLGIIRDLRKRCRKSPAE